MICAGAACISRLLCRYLLLLFKLYVLLSVSQVLQALGCPEVAAAVRQAQGGGDSQRTTLQQVSQPQRFPCLW